MDPVEGTPLWETWNERTSEFTRFNLVIRLSKVKQMAFSFLTPSSDVLNSWPPFWAPTFY